MSKSDYITLLGEKSPSKYHELIEQCLDFYNVNGTRELTKEQIVNYCKLKGLVQEDENDYIQYRRYGSNRQHTRSRSATFCNGIHRRTLQKGVETQATEKSLVEISLFLWYIVRSGGGTI